MPVSALSRALSAGAGVSPDPRTPGRARPRGERQIWRGFPPASGWLRSRPPHHDSRHLSPPWVVADGMSSKSTDSERYKKTEPSRCHSHPLVPRPEFCSPGASLSRLLVQVGLSGHGENGSVFRPAQEREGVGGFGACGSRTMAPGSESPALRRSGRHVADGAHAAHARPARLVPGGFTHAANVASPGDSHTSETHADRVAVGPCSGNYIDPNLPVVCFAIFTQDSLFSY